MAMQERLTMQVFDRVTQKTRPVVTVITLNDGLYDFDARWGDDDCHIASGKNVSALYQDALAIARLAVADVVGG